MTKEQVDIIRNNWIKASNELKFEITSPFYFEYQNMKYSVFGFLPNHGKRKGMIICLGDFDSIEELVNPKIEAWADDKDIFFSVLNYQAYLNYNINIFKEAIDDWRIF